MNIIKTYSCTSIIMLSGHLRLSHEWTEILSPLRSAACVLLLLVRTEIEGDGAKLL